MIICPHAGLSYCLNVQSSVFSQIDLNNYKRIIILGVCHSFTTKNICQSPFEYWDTPFTDQPLKVTQTQFNTLKSQYCQREHSIELLLPYLSFLMKKQCPNKQFEFIPLYIGTKIQENDIQKLQSLIDEQTLIIASSDFIHFGTNFDYYPSVQQLNDKNKNIYSEAVDMINLTAIEKMKISADKFYQYVYETEATICGLYTIFAGLSAIKYEHVELMRYEKSDIITNPNDTVVCYCGVIIY